MRAVPVAVGGILVLASLTPAAPALADTPTCDGQPATIVATPDLSQSYTRVDGTDDADVIYLPDPDPYHVQYDVFTEGGDDIVCGWWGAADLVDGGTGNDRIEVGRTIYGGVGDDEIRPAGDLRTTTLDGGPGNDTIEGTPGEDFIYDDVPSPYDSPVPAVDGADVIDGNGGNDHITLDAGEGSVGAADVVDGGPGGTS